MLLKLRVVRIRYRIGGPEQGVVVGKRGEEDAEEEADSYWPGFSSSTMDLGSLSSYACSMGRKDGHGGGEGRLRSDAIREDLRPMMRKVANEPEPR